MTSTFALALLVASLSTQTQAAEPKPTAQATQETGTADLQKDNGGAESKGDGDKGGAQIPEILKSDLSRSQLTRAEREILKRELMEEVNATLDEQRMKLRAEIKAQIEAESANRMIEDNFVLREDKPRLELLELNGYLRVRPELFYNVDMGRGLDPNGQRLFPKSATGGKTLGDTNMRWRIEPTLNISEDVRLHAQIDVLDNLIFGATPEGIFGPNETHQFSIANRSQAPVTSGKNWFADAIQAKKIYGEVVTPIGQFLFGRMGSHWGAGILTNGGDTSMTSTSSYGGSDAGDVVDRLMFVSMPLAGHYIVPFIDFVSSGPTSIRRGELFGQSVDLSQNDDAFDYGISIARRDTDLEIKRKIEAGRSIINYGAYFVYRTQSYDAAGFNSAAYPDADPEDYGYVARKASFYIPDLWFKFQSKRWRAELELAGIFGKIDDVRLNTDVSAKGQDVSVMQFGGVAKGEFLPIPSLSINLEFGFASGDKSAGMGNSPGRGGATSPGVIDGPQFCVDESCAERDGDVNNFRFNRAYQVDLILWRELFQGVTDAIYLKPGIRYEIIKGFDVWANFIYSRSIYGESTPSSALDSVGNLSGKKDLGLEIDVGAQYVSGDGFVAGIGYGVLFPLAGLDNRIEDKSAATAHLVRGWFGIVY